MENFTRTPEQLNQAKAILNELDINEKSSNWLKELNEKCLHVEGITPPDAEGDMELPQNIQDEFLIYNLRVLEQAKDYARAKLAFRPRENVFIYDVEKEILDSQLKDATNPIALLNKEKAWLQDLVAKYETYSKETFVDIINGNPDEIDWKFEVPKAWLDAYEDYYIRGKEIDLSFRIDSAYYVLAKNNGCEVAKYHEYIDKKIQVISKKQAPLSKEETSVKRQLLLLYYTGYIKELSKNIKTDEERNILLALILNKHKQNIKKVLTYINKTSDLYEIKTDENLTFVLDALNKAGLEKEALEVKKDLDALRQRKSSPPLPPLLDKN